MECLSSKLNNESYFGYWKTLRLSRNDIVGFIVFFSHKFFAFFIDSFSSFFLGSKGTSINCQCILILSLSLFKGFAIRRCHAALNKRQQR